MIESFVGGSAAVLTMFSFVPQIVKIVRTRSCRDVSILTLLQLSAGVTLWIIYGIMRADRIIILANVITLSSLGVIMYLRHRFRNAQAQ